MPLAFFIFVPSGDQLHALREPREPAGELNTHRLLLWVTKIISSNF